MTAENTALTAPERAALDDCERRIERGLKTFIEVGTALAHIRDQRLYRASHATFETYAKERFNLSRPRVYELMAAAGAVSGIPDTLPTPTNAGQAAELAKVPKSLRTAVWTAAIQRTGGKPTAAAIRRVHDERVGMKPDIGTAIVSLLECAGAEGLSVAQLVTLAFPGLAPTEVASALARLSDEGRVLVVAGVADDDTATWALTKPPGTAEGKSVVRRNGRAAGRSTWASGAGNADLSVVGDVQAASPPAAPTTDTAEAQFVPEDNPGTRAWAADFTAHVTRAHSFVNWLQVDDATEFATEGDVEALRDVALAFTRLHQQLEAVRTTKMTRTSPRSR